MRTPIAFHILASTTALFKTASAFSFFRPTQNQQTPHAHARTCLLQPAELKTITLGPDYNSTQLLTALETLANRSEHLHHTQSFSISLAQEYTTEVYPAAVARELQPYGYRNPIDELANSESAPRSTKKSKYVSKYTSAKKAAADSAAAATNIYIPADILQEHGWREHAYRHEELVTNGVNPWYFDLLRVVEEISTFPHIIPDKAREVHFHPKAPRIDIAIMLFAVLSQMPNLNSLSLSIPPADRMFSSPVWWHVFNLKNNTPLLLHNVKTLHLGAGTEFLIPRCPNVETIIATEAYMPVTTAQDMIASAMTAAKLRHFQMTAFWSLKDFQTLTLGTIRPEGLRTLVLKGALKTKLKELLPLLNVFEELQTLELPALENLAEAIEKPSPRSAPSVSLEWSRRKAAGEKIIALIRSYLSNHVVGSLVQVRLGGAKLLLDFGTEKPLCQECGAEEGGVGDEPEPGHSEEELEALEEALMREWRGRI